MASRPGLDRTTVVREAAVLADTLGLEQVTLAALAQRLKVKTPSLYNHVEGMPGLRKELALYAIVSMRERLTGAALGKSGDDAVYAVGIAYVSFVRERPGLYEASLAAPDLTDPDVQAASAQVVELMMRILDKYGLEREEALHTVRGLRSLVHGFSSLELKKGFGLELDRDESLRRLLATYIRGIHSR